MTDILRYNVRQFCSKLDKIAHEKWTTSIHQVVDPWLSNGWGEGGVSHKSATEIFVYDFMWCDQLVSKDISHMLC